MLRAVDFNGDFGGQGVMVALGWPGQWEARVSRAREVVRVQGRTPLILIEVPGKADGLYTMKQDTLSHVFDHREVGVIETGQRGGDRPLDERG